MGIILIVDDERSARQALAREFKSHFDLLLAASCQQALEDLAGPDGSRVCAVVTDCDMGAGLATGLDLLATLRSSLPRLKRILVSGSITDTGGQQHIASGLVHRCFGKPWEVGTICDAVRVLVHSQPLVS